MIDCGPVLDLGLTVVNDFCAANTALTFHNGKLLVLSEADQPCMTCILRLTIYLFSDPVNFFLLLAKFKVALISAFVCNKYIFGLPGKKAV